jgi:hypothetical protein
MKSEICLRNRGTADFLSKSYENLGRPLYEHTYCNWDLLGRKSVPGQISGLIELSADHNNKTDRNKIYRGDFKATIKRL